ncbi:MAG: HD domain-containing protein [Elusimicrobia bacterium]|nr:HD domain-containing protein [Elusimicrobiota bacterium]
MSGLEALRRDPLLAAARAALAPGEEGWLVGGLLRDAALGARGPLVDLDLAVSGPAGPYARRLARRLGGASAFPLDAGLDIHRLSLKAAPGRPAAQVDVARVQGGSIAADLARRDFTVNAMALPLAGAAALLDPLGGLADARAGLLRATAEKVFPEDPLRILRLFRLGARTGLAPETRTLAWAKRHRALIRRPAGERVRAELMSLLAAPDSAVWLRRLDEARILTEVFPELEPARACARSYYGPGGVMEHSLRTVERVDFLLASLGTVFPDHHAEIGAVLEAGGGRSELLRLGALLHDVSKPECAKRVGGRLRFFGHDEVGAGRARAALARLRFSRDEQDSVEAWVRHHLRPGHLAAGGPITDKAVYRFFRDLGERGVTQLLVCWADHASYLEPKSVERGLEAAAAEPGTPLPRWARGDAGKTLHHLRVVGLLLSRWFRSPARTRPTPLLDGNAVMKALKLKPGPEVGEVLRALTEAQAEGAVTSRTEALAWLRSR